MAGTDSVLGLRRIWQSLLVQVVSQALLVAGLLAGDAVASATGSYDMGYNTAIVVTAVALVAQMVAWVEIVAILGRPKDRGPAFVSASRWYLVSFCLVFAYFVCHSTAGVLQLDGAAGVALSLAESIVVSLRDIASLVALWKLIEGCTQYLDSLGEPSARLRSFHRVRTSLAVIVIVQLMLALPATMLSILAPDSLAYGVVSLIEAFVNLLGFIAQVIATLRVRATWKIVEGMLG